MYYRKRTVTITDTKTNKLLEQDDVYLPNLSSIIGFLRGSWNLNTYNDCFGGKNRIGDVDGSIEVDGKHLMIEFKKSPEAMNIGQTLKALRLAKYSNTPTLFVFGATDKPTHRLYITKEHTEGVMPKLVQTDEDELKAFFQRWYTEAKLKNRIDREELNKDMQIANKITGELS